MSNTALAKTPTSNIAPVGKPSALAAMASRLSCDPAKMLSTLKATVFKAATDEEIMALVVVANEYGLNPFLKELYAFPAKGGGIVPIVSVDGWNKMLIRQPQFDGIKFSFEENEQRQPISCTATVFVKERSHPLEITEYYDECQRNTDNWKNMPHRMLRNRTLCQASRLAFGFSGVYHEDEAATITVDSTVTPSEPPPKLVAAPSENKTTPQQELEAAVLAAGHDFNLFQKFGESSGNLPDASSLSGFDEVPSDLAKRLLKNQTGFLKALESLKA